MRTAKPLATFTTIAALVAFGEARCVGEDAQLVADGSVSDGAASSSSGGGNGSSGAPADGGRAAFGKVAQLVSGDTHTCARSDTGKVRCWGGNAVGQLGQNLAALYRADVDATSTIDFGTNDPVIELASSHETVCALFQSGLIRCWGNNGAGERGAGTVDLKGNAPRDTLRLESVDLGPDRLAAHVYAGTRHFCAIIRGGDVACWGFGTEPEGRFGWLGNGVANHVGDQANEMGDALALANLPEKSVELALGFTVSCARSVTDAIRCWGIHRAGQLGSGDATNNPDLDVNGSLTTLMPVASGASALFGRGPALSARLEDGGIVTWGQNQHGQLGFGDTTDRGAPTALPVEGVRLVRSGPRHRCVVYMDGRLICLGFNSHGQLGYGDTMLRGNSPETSADKLAPVRTNVADVTVGSEHTCALQNDGAVVCWGRNNAGQLGYGDTTDRGHTADSAAAGLPALPPF